MTILIVDDAELVRTMLIEYLDAAGYVAAEAAGGREALEYLRTQPCQLVFLDVMMSMMNGWELLQAMHADPALKRIPVVIMTAADHVDKIAREQGAVGYLPKPINHDALMDIVRSHVSGQ
jgi:CheY-like chemotaxis protein